jgi:hypothetical protein
MENVPRAVRVLFTIVLIIVASIVLVACFKAAMSDDTPAFAERQEISRLKALEGAEIHEQLPVLIQYDKWVDRHDKETEKTYRNRAYEDAAGLENAGYTNIKVELVGADPDDPKSKSMYHITCEGDPKKINP